MISNDKMKAIASLDLDPIKAKLMHVESGEGWSAEKANAVETEYRRFLCLMKLYPQEQTAPLVDVDTFWHYHILDTVKYAADCAQAFGYFLHHYPYLGMAGEDDEAQRQAGAQRMQELYEQTFGGSYLQAAAALQRAAFCAAANDAAFCAAARPAFCAATAKQAFCAATAKPAFCAATAGAALCAATAKSAFCAATAKSAFCAATASSAFCAATATSAFCAATIKSAFCAASASSAFCATTAKPAFCAATTVGSAFCAASNQAAFCAAISKPAFCAATAKTAFCATAAGTGNRRAEDSPLEALVGT